MHGSGLKVLEPAMIFPGEEIVHVTGYHWIYVLKSFLPFVLIIAVGTVLWSLVPSRLTSTLIMLALIVSIVWIVVKILDTVVKRCYVTNRRLINRSGWTKRDTPGRHPGSNRRHLSRPDADRTYPRLWPGQADRPHHSDSPAGISA